jgi:methyl-accepting chemotaxis protein
MQRSQLEANTMLDVTNNVAAIIEYDPEGNIIKANANALKATGYSSEELKGEHHRIFVNRDERNSESYRKLWRDVSNGLLQSGEYKLQNKVGKDIWVRGQYTPVINRDGVVTKVTQIFFDITQYKTQA